MQRIPFDDTYRAPYPQVSRAVRCDDLIFTSGQLDVDGCGRLQHEGDLSAETRRSMSLLYDAVEQAGGGVGDIVHLQVFYRDSGQIDEAAYRGELASLLPDNCRPVLTLTPIETFPKGVQVEVDAIARVGAELQRVDQARVCAVRAGDLLFLHAEIDSVAQTAPSELDTVERCLTDLGGSPDDVVKLRFYSDALTTCLGETERRVLERFPAPGPVYTRLPLAPGSAEERRSQIEMIAVIGAETRTGRRYLLPEEYPTSPWGLFNPQALRSRRYVFVGGQHPVDVTGKVQHRGLIKPQIAVVMGRLKGVLSVFDLDLGDVAKINAYHQGRENKAAWTENVQIRADFYPSPGPASTGVEVSTVGLDGGLISLDCVALESAS